MRVVYLDRSLAPGGGGDGDGNGEVRGALSLVGVAWCGTVGQQAACYTEVQKHLRSYYCREPCTG